LRPWRLGEKLIRRIKAKKRQVELVTVESLSPYLGPHILAEVEYATIAA